jgi:hypothetical protein
MRDAGGPDRKDNRKRPLIERAWPTGELNGRTASDPAQRLGPDRPGPRKGVYLPWSTIGILCANVRQTYLVHKKVACTGSGRCKILDLNFGEFLFYAREGIRGLYSAGLLLSRTTKTGQWA